MASKRSLIYLLFIFLTMLLLVSVSAGQKTHETNTEDTLAEMDEAYPDDLDLLEEVIQSYYLLLESESITDKYSMLNQSANVIDNQNPALTGFYTKLAKLRSGQLDRVSVLQIGDSHIQPGYFSGTARSALQSYFGNAGRGLVFPWKLAGTNQPDDIRISSQTSWQRTPSEVGICGYGLQTQTFGTLVIQTNSFFHNDNTFDLITLILKEKENSYKVSVVGQEDYLTTRTSAFADQSIYQLGWVTPVNKAELTLKAAKPHDRLNLYGIILEKQQPGLLYHSMGTNGASFDKMAKIDEFFPQIRILAPDLIIVSLGTNDVQGSFREEAYLKALKQFMKPLKKAVPQAPVLFTLPPDSYKNGTANRDITKANQLLTQYAKDNGYAWWDLRAVMGGAESIRQWRNMGLASGDFKHYTPKGYMLQGHLFQQALLKGYKKFAEQR